VTLVHDEERDVGAVEVAGDQARVECGDVLEVRAAGEGRRHLGLGEPARRSPPRVRIRAEMLG
jgi:hypothetical protein